MAPSSPAAERLEQTVRQVCGELGRRLRAKETATAEEYLAQYPEIAAHTDLALEVIYTEYIVRSELGQRVSSDDWFTRFPQWRQDLQQLLQVHQQVCEDEVRPSAVLPVSRSHSGKTSAGLVVARLAVSEEGRTVGNYQVFHELGRGGMGVVYRARQISLNRDVALKMVLSGEYASPAELARFQTEAKSAARLQHPNIVQIFEVGSHEGRSFLSMELVDGGNLDTHLKTVRPSARESAQLVETLARTVDFAHQRGVVHRDLKPSNVLLTLQGAPKIADFGLAKQITERPAEHTRSGVMVGTPSYMAPEQALGRSADVGPATDVYALGVILYEMLTGSPPLVGDTPLETVRRVAHEEPVAPSKLQTTVPRDLDTITLKCLEKDPRRRYHSAAELADDLRRHLSNEPIRAKTIGTAERLIKWMRRRPALAAFIASLALGLVTVSTLWQLAENRRRDAEFAAQRAERLRQEAETAQRRAEGEQRRAEGEQQRAERALYLRRIAKAQAEFDAYHVGRADQILDECPVELRDWEWRYSKSLCHRYLRNFVGHTDVIWSLAISPDGRTIASGSGEWGWSRPGEVILWDVASGAIRAQLTGHNGPIMNIAFSPDGQLLATASTGWEGVESAHVKIWTAAGEELLTLPKPGNNAFAVQFSHDSQLLATAGPDGTIRLWSARTGTLEGQLVGHRGPVFDLAFSPDGKFLASAGRDGAMRVWDVANRVAIQAFTGYGDLRQVRYSPDGRFLVFTNYGRDLYLWEVTAPADRIEKYTMNVNVILSLAFSPDARRIALSGSDGSVVIVETRTDVELKRMRTHNGVVRDLAFLPDGRQLATAGMDRLVRLWDARTDFHADQVRLADYANVGSFHRMAFTPEGRFALLPNGFNRGFHGAGETTLLVFDLVERKLASTLRGHTDWLTDCAVSPDGGLYASASKDRTARVWNAATGTIAWQLTGHEGTVTGVSFDRRGERLASSSNDGTIRLWNLSDGQLLRELVGHDGPVSRVAFDRTSDVLASAGSDGSVRLWDPDTGEMRRALLGHSGNVTSLAFSHDGQLLVTAGEDETVCIWRRETGERLHQMRGHTGTVLDAAFSRDDRRVGSCGADWTVKLWDVESGEEALTLHNDGPMLCLAFHPDERRIAAVGNWTMQFWDSANESPPQADAAFDRANLAWFEREAKKCLDNRQFPPVVFYCDRAIGLQPQTARHYARRGIAAAELRDWPAAAADFARSVELSADARAYLANHLLVQLYLGNVDEYRRLSQKLLAGVTADSNSVTLNNTVWFLSLAPQAVPDLHQVVELAERARQRGRQEQRRIYINTLGSAQLRAGNLEEARQNLETSLQLAEVEPVEDWLLLAILHTKRGQPQEARKLLDQALAKRDACLERKADGTPLPLTWTSWICREILFREALATVPGSDSAASPP